MFALRATTGKLCVVSLCEFLVRNRSIVVFSVSEWLLFVFPIRLKRDKGSNTKVRVGMGTADKKKAWWGLQFFQFLSDKNVPRQTVSSKTQDEVSEDLLSENEDLLSSAGPSRTSTPFSSASLFSGTSNSSVSSKPVAKRGNKRKLVDKAFNIMTTCFNEMQQEPKPTKDEHTVYGECVANRIRKIKNPMRLCIVKNKIDNILFEAEMEEYKDVSEKPEQNKTSEQPGTFEKPVEEEDIGNISSLIASSMNTVSGYFEDS
ncbi:hypothetical protein J6590_067159 [Homalodisca vitripennis]|nr:hypothetical protein J6590_067159 [Homalodisca vitripennis]